MQFGRSWRDHFNSVLKRVFKVLRIQFLVIHRISVAQDIATGQVVPSRQSLMVFCRCFMHFSFDAELYCSPLWVGGFDTSLILLSCTWGATFKICFLPNKANLLGIIMNQRPRLCKCLLEQFSSLKNELPCGRSELTGTKLPSQNSSHCHFCGLAPEESASLDGGELSAQFLIESQLGVHKTFFIMKHVMTGKSGLSFWVYMCIFPNAAVSGPGMFWNQENIPHSKDASKRRPKEFVLPNLQMAN